MRQLRFVGHDDTGKRMEVVELDRSVHPFFFGHQAHPEFRSGPGTYIDPCSNFDIFFIILNHHFVCYCCFVCYIYTIQSGHCMLFSHQCLLRLCKSNTHIAYVLHGSGYRYDVMLDVYAVCCLCVASPLDGS